MWNGLEEEERPTKNNCNNWETSTAWPRMEKDSKGFLPVNGYKIVGQWKGISGTHIYKICRLKKIIMLLKLN